MTLTTGEIFISSELNKIVCTNEMISELVCNMQIVRELRQRKLSDEIMVQSLGRDCGMGAETTCNVLVVELCTLT